MLRVIFLSHVFKQSALPAIETSARLHERCPRDKQMMGLAQECSQLAAEKVERIQECCLLNKKMVGLV